MLQVWQGSDVKISRERYTYYIPKNLLFLLYIRYNNNNHRDEEDIFHSFNS